MAVTPDEAPLVVMVRDVGPGLADSQQRVARARTPASQSAPEWAPVATKHVHRSAMSSSAISGLPSAPMRRASGAGARPSHASASQCSAVGVVLPGGSAATASASAPGAPSGISPALARCRPATSNATSTSSPVGVSPGPSPLSAATDSSNRRGSTSPATIASTSRSRTRLTPAHAASRAPGPGARPTRSDVVLAGATRVASCRCSVLRRSNVAAAAAIAPSALTSPDPPCPR